MDYVQLILKLIAAFPQDLAAVEEFWTTVSSDWSETDNQRIQQALDDAKAAADAEQQELDAEE